MDRQIKKQTKRQKAYREDSIDIRKTSITIMQPIQSVINQGDTIEALDNQLCSSISMVATDTPDNKVEIVAASEAALIQTSFKPDDNTAVVKIDSNYALVSEAPQTIEKEHPLSVKRDSKLSIKPSISNLESMEVTEINVGDFIDDNGSLGYKIENNKATQSLVPVEGIITSETLVNMKSSELKSDEIKFARAKSSLLLKDALDVTEQTTSHKEGLFENAQIIETHAAVSIFPLAGINVNEVSHEQREHDFILKPDFKDFIPELNFNLHESIQVGEVFVEDKSGKYYPELIVPTEMATKEVLVSNQIVTEIHDVQEKEGMLQARKLPPSQEANIDVTTTDSLVMTEESTNEKEGDFPIADDVAATASADILLHSSLTNITTTSEIKETNYIPDSYTSIQANVGVTECLHKFNIETEVHESETSLEHVKPKLSQVEINISTLDKNVTHELEVNEKEKELLLADNPYAAKAKLDVKLAQPIVTSEVLQINSATDFHTDQNTTEVAATESFPTENSKTITELVVHEQEVMSHHSIRKPENVMQTFTPMTSLEITETALTESENILSVRKVPEGVIATTSSTHHLKIPVAEVITTADQIELLNKESNITSTASIYRDLQEEIRVLQANVQEQLETLQHAESTSNTITPMFIGKESINVTEVVPTFTEESFNAVPLRSGKFAKLDLDADHKTAVTSEISPRYALDQLYIQPTQYEEAVSTSKALKTLQITANEALDSQSLLKPDMSPDSKMIVPEVVSNIETVKISEVLQHEKEGTFTNTLAPESFIASTEITSQMVAISSELISQSSTGYTDQDDVQDKLKKATVDNIALKEIVVTSVNVSEKETILDAAYKPNTVVASLHIDSSEGIIVEEKLSELEPTAFDTPLDAMVAKVKQSAITKESVLQEETLVHTSEGVLPIQELENKKPLVTFSTLQAPQYDENLSVECEAALEKHIEPTKKSAEVSITKQHGLEITEMLSQIDNIKDVNASLEMNLNTAVLKTNDEHYAKIASTQEVLTIQSTENLPISKIIEEKIQFLPIELHTMQRTEVVPAEAENILPISTKREQVVIKPTIADKVAIITTTVEPEDNETEFSSKPFVSLKDANIKFEPHTSTIDTEVLPSSSAEQFLEPVPKSSVAAFVQGDTQPHILGVTTLHGEKEGDLPNDAKALYQKGLQKFVEASAKEISEVQTVEQEICLGNVVTEVGVAQSIIDEHRSLLQTEICLSHESEQIQTPNVTLSSITPTQSLQEAIQADKPFIGESEGAFLETLPGAKTTQSKIEELKSVLVTEINISDSEIPLRHEKKVNTEILNEVVQGHTYLDVTEVLSNEFENELRLTESIPSSTKVAASSTIKLQSHVNVNETITNEGVSLGHAPSMRSQNADINVQPCDYISTSEQISIENEGNLNPAALPKGVKSLVSVQPHSHINIEEYNTSEVTSKERIQPSVPCEDIFVSLEPQHHITVTDTFLKEDESDLSVPVVGRSEAKTADIETTQHIIVSEAIATEKESEFIGKPLFKDEKALPSPVCLQEISSSQANVFDSVSDMDKNYEPHRDNAKLDIGISKSYQVLEQVLHEDVKTFQSIAPDSTNANKLLDSLKPLVLSETFPVENPEAFSKRLPKDEKALASHTITEELINTQPQIIETSKVLENKYEPEEMQGNIQIEFLKSYTTTEHNSQQFPENINVPELNLEKATQKHLVNDELTNSMPEVLENVSQLTLKTEPDSMQANIDMKLSQSYTVTEHATHEAAENFQLQKTMSNKANEQFLDLKSIHQTQVIAEESTAVLETNQDHGRNIAPKPIEIETLSQTDILIHEYGTESIFDKPYAKEIATVSHNLLEGLSIHQETREVAEGNLIVKKGDTTQAIATVTPHMSLQCTENITESHADTFTPELIQNTSTKVTTIHKSPLIITDTVGYQHEGELNLAEPKKQTIPSSVTLASEVAVTSEFVHEQTQQITEQKQTLSETKVPDVEFWNITVSQPEILGK